MLALDVLHVADHGTAQHVYANTLHSLIFGGLPGTPKQNLDVIWVRMQELYVALGITNKLHTLTLKMFTPDPDSPYADFPEVDQCN